MKKNFRASKYELLTEEVQLLEANPISLYVRLSDRRMTTVCNKRLSSIPQPLENELLLQNNDNLERERMSLKMAIKHRCVIRKDIYTSSDLMIMKIYFFNFKKQVFIQTPKVIRMCYCNHQLEYNCIYN